MKKLISVAVILLFIGLAFAPSINANVGKEELVEFTTEVCGLNGGKQTVKLTQQQADEVEALFDSIREKLNATESREEAEEIFKDAVVELDKYGLLGGLSVKQAQRLVTGPYFKEGFLRIFEKLKVDTLKTSNNSNLFCLISSKTQSSSVPLYLPITVSVRLYYDLIRLMWFLRSKIDFFDEINLGENFATILGFYHAMLIFFLPLIPIRLALLNAIVFGGIHTTYPKEVRSPAEGKVDSYGVYGYKRFDGKMWGQISAFFYGFGHLYIGVRGFTGLTIIGENQNVPYVWSMGYARYINIGPDEPDFKYYPYNPYWFL